MNQSPAELLGHPGSVFRSKSGKAQTRKVSFCWLKGRKVESRELCAAAQNPPRLSRCCSHLCTLGSTSPSWLSTCRKPLVCTRDFSCIKELMSCSSTSWEVPGIWEKEVKSSSLITPQASNSFNNLAVSGTAALICWEFRRMCCRTRSPAYKSWPKPGKLNRWD